MSCNNPLYGFRSLIPNERTGKYPVLFSGSSGGQEYLPVPCGKCTGCLTDRTIGWAIRCVHEMQYHKENSFITLTYDNNHLPKNKMLNKRHLQLFWKSLRKKYPEKTIKYLACGEYGERTYRAHYHAIIFGYEPQDLVRYKKNQYEQWLYFSAELNAIWKKGMVIVGECSFGTAQYVAKYVNKDKEQHNLLEKDENFVKPYNISSQGLGKRYLEKKWKEIYRYDRCLIDSNMYKPPRYYDKWLEENQEDKFCEIKDERLKKAKEHERNDKDFELHAREQKMRQKATKRDKI